MKKKILIILIIIVLLIAALWGINRYLGGFMIHEDGISIAFPKNGQPLSHIVTISTKGSDIVTSLTQIYSFKNNKCISHFVQYEYIDEEEAKKQYNNLKDIKQGLTNISLNKNTVSYNSMTDIDLTKEKILESLKTKTYDVFIY